MKTNATLRTLRNPFPKFVIASLSLLSLCALHIPLFSASPSLDSSAPPSHDAEKLAKDVSNPVSSLISLPIQQNFDFGYAGGGWRSTTNIQPVYPVKINDDWNMINRAILPVIYQDDVTHNGDDFGLGDTTVQIFFSPAKKTASGLIWGVGPALLLPTATKDVLGTDKWSAGPAALVLKQDDKLTYGLLINHVWSFAGNDRRSDISNTFIQPFVSYNAGRGRTYGVNFESSYDWENSQWTIPLNVSASQVLKFGKQLASVGIGARVYLDRPHGGPDWGLRFVVQFLFPQ